jgi:hypothetical protein
MNSTVFPLLGPIGSFVNTIKFAIGGVFGVYLIILYFRVREYIVVRRLLLNIQKDIRILAENQGVEMPPARKLPTVGEYVKERAKKKLARKRKKEVEQKKKTAKR